jgi:CheY-like chemotaxis protein
MFRALVVDDDSDVRRKALDAAVPAEGLEVLVAATMSEAIDLIVDNFLHLAVVDLELSSATRQLAEGQTVLRALRTGRPSCRRVLLTKYTADMPEKVFELLDPAAPVLDGAIDKGGFGDYFDSYVSLAAEAWERGPVRIENLDEVSAMLKRKAIRGPEVLPGRRAAVTQDELGFVLARLFGQRMREDDPDPDDIECITLRPFTGGKSRSVVLHGRPVNRLGHHGLLCVVKVGPRQDAEQELARYERYVRLRMSLSRRVELLGNAMGDTLGAIAYSFAGHDPGEVQDLQALLDAGDPDALSRMHDVFAGTDWTGESPDGPDLARFFFNAYNLRPHAVRKDIEDFADEHATTYGWQHRRNELRLPGGKLHLPDAEDTGRGLLHRSFRTAVVHGDLNASNVILADDERSIIIDYRHTTRGPRTMDLAASPRCRPAYG